MAYPAYATEMLGHLLLFFLVFGMSATVDISRLLKQLRNTRALSMGVFLQFVILPFLGFLSVKMLALNEAMGITLLVVTSSPGGSFSNWWCSIFNADLALSVTMTAISTILAIVMLPLNLYIYIPLAFNDDEVDVLAILDFSALMNSLLVVISAISLGIFASDKVPHRKFHVYANRFGSFAGVSLVLLSGIVSNMSEGDGIWQRAPKFYFGVAAPCITALVLSNLMTSHFDLKKPERVTSSIECCYQNCGIATSVALAMFEGQDRALALGVPFFYGVVEFLVIGTYCLGAWKAGWTKAPPNEPFWKVITCSYEVLLAEKLARERNIIEVQLSGVEVSDEYRNAAEDGKGGIGALAAAATCLYYCHEPDLDTVDPPPAPTKTVETPVEVPEKEDAKEDVEKQDVHENAEKTDEIEDNYVILGGTDDRKETTKSIRSLFWTSLGYKIPEE